MPSTSHPPTPLRPVTPGRSSGDATAPDEAARLPEGKTVLFYPSCGYGLLWSLLSLPGEIVVMSDDLPHRQPGWCNWQQFCDRITRDFAQHGIPMTVDHCDASLCRFQAAGKSVWLFFEDNNEVVRRLADAGGRIQTMVGICDGCCEGGNYECVNDTRFLTTVLALATADFRLYLDHSPLLEDKYRGWFHGEPPRHAYFHERHCLDGAIAGTLILDNLLVAPRLQRLGNPWNQPVTEADLVLFPYPHEPSGLTVLAPFRTRAQRPMLAEYRFESDTKRFQRTPGGDRARWYDADETRSTAWSPGGLSAGREPQSFFMHEVEGASSGYPPFTLLHVPHASTTIPPEVRDQFVLDDDALQQEILRMTDHATDRLFVGQAQHVTIIQAPVSRLVVDVERFPSDIDEPMAAVGMGAVYTRTTDGLPLRRPLTTEAQYQLLKDYYFPHHFRLERAVSLALRTHQRALILDCHSFPDQRLPHEPAEDGPRPDICIGTDDFHTPALLREALVRAFESHGFTVAVNHPYAGALVPLAFYRQDARVMAVMVEINRRLYLDETTGRLRQEADALQWVVSTLCQQVTALFDLPRRQRPFTM